MKIKLVQYFAFILKTALLDLKANKVRTFLTALGILVGISSVVLLISFGLGLKRYLSQQFESLGSNLIMVLPGRALQGGLRPGAGTLGGARFDLKDIRSLKRLDSLEAVAAGFSRYFPIFSRDKSKVYEIIGSTEEIFDIMNFVPDEGRFFDKTHVDKKSKVIVLGANPADYIFGGAKYALGQTVKVEGLSFAVIGVSEKKGGGGFGPSVDDHAFIPYTAGISFNPSKKFIGLYGLAKSDKLVDQAKKDIKQVLLERYDEDDFTVTDQQEVLDVFSSVFEIVNIVLVAIAAISLVVGGVGVMNIMYVSVAEKTKEIGIRRSVGATKRDILFQFLAESVILAILGGILGLLLAFGVIALIQRYFPAYISVESVFLALSLSSATGIIFGVFPARKAADLTPVEAIRKK